MRSDLTGLLAGVRRRFSGTESGWTVLDFWASG